MSYKPDTASKFMRFALSREEEQLATHASPLLLAYIQNKIEAYASALVETELPYSSNPTEQVKAILAHERLRNFCQAYEELLSELLQATSDSNQPT